MSVRTGRLVLGLFFLLMGSLLLLLRFGMPEVLDRFNPTRIFVGAMMALVLSGWNLIRWYAAWIAFHEQATPIRRPLQPDPDAPKQAEYNPEFDFDKRNEK